MAQGSLRKRRKIVRYISSGFLVWIIVFWTCQGCCTHGLPVATTYCTKSTPYQTSPTRKLGGKWIIGEELEGREWVWIWSKYIAWLYEMFNKTYFKRIQPWKYLKEQHPRQSRKETQIIRQRQEMSAPGNPGVHKWKCPHTAAKKKKSCVLHIVTYENLNRESTQKSKHTAVNIIILLHNEN